MNTRRCITNSR